MVTKIKAGLRRIGLRFDALSVLLLCEMHGIEIHELDKIDRLEYLPSWSWCAYKSYQIRSNRRIHINYKKMKRLLAGLRMSEYRKINETIMNVTPKDEKGNARKTEDSKKKQPGRISSSQDGGQG